MTLQARMSEGDHRLYSANRDVAHNFDQVIMEVADRVEKGNWDYLTALAKREGVTDEDLGRVCATLCLFVIGQLDNKKESMASCMARCGFLELKPAARAIVMAYLGIVTLGIHWAGVREATIGGIGPVLTYGRLRWYGRRCMLLMRMPWWRRRLYVLRGRIRAAWRAFWQSHRYEVDVDATHTATAKANTRSQRAAGRGPAGVSGPGGRRPEAQSNTPGPDGRTQSV